MYVCAYGRVREHRESDPANPAMASQALVFATLNLAGLLAGLGFFGGVSNPADRRLWPIWGFIANRLLAAARKHRRLQPMPPPDRYLKVGWWEGDFLTAIPSGSSNVRIGDFAPTRIA